MPGDPDPETWPTRGELNFRDVTMRYRPDLPAAIKNVSVKVPGGKHVGIVGRTGAGKTSFIVVLFRLVDAATGIIELDGRDLRSLGLHAVRRALSIIPQKPLLIPGDVAHNLDPFGVHGEQTLRGVMERVGLPVQQFSKPADDLSVGQQQLLALGRLLLRTGSDRPKIIVMDEPTANIDALTDETIQKIINEEFKGTTMLTIAHRLNTVITSDLMLVMDAGKVHEFQSPTSLLSDETTLLSSMVDALGVDAASALRAQAREAEAERHKN